MDLDLGNLPIEATRHERSPSVSGNASTERQGYAQHDPERFDLDAALAVISTPLSSQRPAKTPLRKCDGSSARRLPRWLGRHIDGVADGAKKCGCAQSKLFPRLL